MNTVLILSTLDATLRLSTPLLLACLPASIPSGPACSTSGSKARC